MRRRSVTGAEVGPTPVTDAVTGGASALPLALEVPEVLRRHEGVPVEGVQGVQALGLRLVPAHPVDRDLHAEAPLGLREVDDGGEPTPLLDGLDRRAAAAGAHQPDVPSRPASWSACSAPADAWSLVTIRTFISGFAWSMFCAMPMAGSAT